MLTLSTSLAIPEANQAFYEEDIAVINEFSKLLKSMRAQMQTRQNTTSAIDRNAFINVLIKHGDKSFNWQTDLGTKATSSSLRKAVTHDRSLRDT